MFKQMRRATQQLPNSICHDILTHQTSGVLALSDPDGYPYALPISYVWHQDVIYFHSAKEGHKIDLIRKNQKASFCVIGQDQVMPEKFTTYYQSVILFGQLRIIENQDEKIAAIRLISEKYAANEMAQFQQELNQYDSRLAIIEMKIEHMTGKEGLDLAQSRQLPKKAKK